MKALIVALAVGFAAVTAVPAANAQMFKGKDCHWAYKKLQQHRVGGRCFEDSARSDRTPADRSGQRANAGNDDRGKGPTQDRGSRGNSGKHDDSSN